MRVLGRQHAPRQIGVGDVALFWNTVAASQGARQAIIFIEFIPRSADAGAAGHGDFCAAW